MKHTGEPEHATSAQGEGETEAVAWEDLFREGPSAVTPTIVGAKRVVAALGEWPSFHDAEIVSVKLVRHAESTVTIDLVDGRARGTQRGTLVTFGFGGIIDLDLHGEDADSQNVISGLSVEDIAEGTKVSFWPCYGLSGHITAKGVNVRIEDDPTKG